MAAGKFGARVKLQSNGFIRDLKPKITDVSFAESFETKTMDFSSRIAVKSLITILRS